MDLLSDNIRAWEDEINLEMPQLVNRQSANNPVQIYFSEIHNRVINRNRGSMANFSEDEDEAISTTAAQVDAAKKEEDGPVPVSTTPEMEANFIQNLQNGMYVDALEEKIGDMPMGVFGYGQGLKGASSAGDLDPERFVAVENTEASNITEIAGPRQVAPVMPGQKVMGINNNPVTDPVEGLPESKVEPQINAEAVDPTATVIAKESNISDPRSQQGVAMMENIIDQMEASSEAEKAQYMEFMNSVI